MFCKIKHNHTQHKTTYKMIQSKTRRIPKKCYKTVTVMYKYMVRACGACVRVVCAYGVRVCVCGDLWCVCVCVYVLWCVCACGACVWCVRAVCGTYICLLSSRTSPYLTSFHMKEITSHQSRHFTKQNEKHI
jgi:hypothetical protein